MRRHPCRLTKRSGEVPIRKFTGASEHVECDAPANVGVEELFGSALLPWRETAFPLQWQCRDVAVSMGNVNRKRERNEVNEEFERFLRSCREGRAHRQQSWRRSLRQGAKVGPSTRRTIADEDPEAFYGRVQGQGRA